MRKKIKTITIIFLIILGYTITNLNINLKGSNIDNEIKIESISRSDNSLRDGNIDWGQLEIISEPIQNNNININSSFKPAMAIENDDIYVVWGDRTDYNHAGEDWDIFFRHYDGTKWLPIDVISEPVQGQDKNTGASSAPDIFVENGKIFVVWNDNNNTNGAQSDMDIFYRCNISGNGWEDIQVISEPIKGQNLNDGFSINPKITGEKGKKFVVWSDTNNTNNAGDDSDIFMKYNLTGTRWDDIQVISEPSEGNNFNTLSSEFPAIAVENDKIFVVWRDNNDTNGAGTVSDIFYRCNLSNYWNEIHVLSEPVLGWNLNIGSCWEPSIAVENGKIYVVWSGTNDTNNVGDDSDIFYICNLTGSHWEDIQVISEPILGENINIGDSESPEIDIENGKIFVVWADKNDTNNAGDDRDIFYRNNITEANWENIQIISEPKKNNNHNTEVSNDPDIIVNSGKNHIVWMDANNTKGSGADADIFYLSTFSPIALGLPRLSPNIGNTDTLFNFAVTYFNLINLPPSKISINITGTEYSLTESNTLDTNYIDGKEYFVNIDKLEIATHTYQFYAFYGNFNWFTKTFYEPIIQNTPPIITTNDDITTFEDLYYETDYEYEDIDVGNIGQSVTWTCITNATWLSFSTSTATLNGTPNNDYVGAYWVNISIDDTIDTDFTNFTLTVINVNDAPIITTDDIEIIDEDEYYGNSYDAIDVDTQQVELFWDMKTNAGWLEFDPATSLLNGTPTNDDVGAYWVNISVGDGEYIDFTNFTLTVIGINDAPVIITDNVIIANEDSYYEVDYEAIDVDNDNNELNWNINTNADWLSIDITTAMINGTPNNDDVGEYWVYISVTDNELTDETNFTFTVANTNDPPLITTDDITTATEDELYSVNYEATDIDPTNDVLTWTLDTNAGEWLTIDSNSGWLNGQPSEKDAGEYWVNVTVSDGKGGYDTHTFTLEVESENAGTFQEESYLFILILIIILIIIVLIITLYVVNKRKAKKLPVYKAELIHTPQVQQTLPSASQATVDAKPLPTPPVVSEQLAMPQTEVPTLAPKAVKPQYQLPQATLTKAQKLGLLEERFLRGEVDLVTYKEFKTKIESEQGEEIPEETVDLEESPQVNQEPTVEQPTEQEPSPEVQAKPQQANEENNS